MHLSLVHITILLLGGLLAGTVDTVAGGGGLISLPALMFVGLPPAMTLGTNQFAMSFGSLVGTVRYAQKRSIRWWPQTLLCAGGVIPGALLGGHAAMALPSGVLHIMVLLLLIGVGVLMTLYHGNPNESSRLIPVTAGKGLAIVLLGLGLGCYEGFFGPGTGLFITMAGVVWLRLPYLPASGTAKAVSLVGNVTAFLTYATHGNVNWTVGLTMAIMVSLGAYIGAWLAHRGGARLIRRVMFGVVGLLAANVLTLLLKHHAR
jgi:uncharacterized membrane protein YfcA